MCACGRLSVVYMNGLILGGRCGVGVVVVVGGVVVVVVVGDVVVVVVVGVAVVLVAVVSLLR